MGHPLPDALGCADLPAWWPVNSFVLVVLLGDAASNQMPVVILAAVTALVVDEMLSTRSDRDVESAHDH